MQKLCSCCSKPAQHSLVFVLSTVGISPRFQKCSSAVLFCDSCFKKLLDSEHWGTNDLRKAVNSAYTALFLRSREQSNATDTERG